MNLKNHCNNLNELCEKLSGNPGYLSHKFNGIFYIILNPELPDLDSREWFTKDIKLLDQRKHLLLSCEGNLEVFKDSWKSYIVGCKSYSFSSYFITKSKWEIKSPEKFIHPKKQYLKAEIFLPGKNNFLLYIFF